MIAVARRAWHRVRKPFAGDPAARLHARIAREFLRGSGLEIGALHNPLPVSAAATVTYVDRMSKSDLLQHYPDLGDKNLVDVAVIDDGETLRTVADASQDFLIANHFLEHTQDPIGTLGRFFAVLKPGGLLYMALPDKRFTFDAPRPVTPLQHLWDDHAHGPERSRRQHFEEFAAAVHHLTDPAAIAAHADHYMKADYSIHFHVWDQPAMLELLLAVRPTLRFDMPLMRANAHEVIFVLKKAAESPGDGHDGYE
jgi:SAM-dependent methyltransferase